MCHIHHMPYITLKYYITPLHEKKIKKLRAFLGTEIETWVMSFQLDKISTGKRRKSEYF